MNKPIFMSDIYLNLFTNYGLYIFYDNSIEINKRIYTLQDIKKINKKTYKKFKKLLNYYNEYRENDRCICDIKYKNFRKIMKNIFDIIELIQNEDFIKELKEIKTYIDKLIKQ